MAGDAAILAGVGTMTRAEIYDACLERAGGKCECGCGRPLGTDLDGHPEMDHFFGRGAGRPAESVYVCWMLRRECHRRKHGARPDAMTWARKFKAHALGQWRKLSGVTSSKYVRIAEGQLLRADVAERLGWNDAIDLAQKRIDWLDSKALVGGGSR